MENLVRQAEHGIRLTVFDICGKFYTNIFAADTFFSIDFARFISTHAHTHMQTHSRATGRTCQMHGYRIERELPRAFVHSQIILLSGNLHFESFQI